MLVEPLDLRLKDMISIFETIEPFKKNQRFFR